MKVVTLKGESRVASGKVGARRARREGKVPAVIYGEGKAPESVSLPEHEFRMAVGAGARVIEIVREGGAERVLLQDMQWDALGMNLVHADFLRVDPEHELTLSVPIDYEGAPKGLADGGVLTILHDAIKVRCLPRDIPERFLIDVSHLALGDSIDASKVPLPAGVKLAEETYTTIVTCAIPRIKVEEAPAAEPGAEGVPVEGAEGAAPAAEGAAPAAAGAKGAAPAAAAKGAAAAAPAEKPAKEGKGEKRK